MKNFLVRFKLNGFQQEEEVYANDTCQAKRNIEAKYRGSNISAINVFTESQRTMMRPSTTKTFNIRYKLNGRDMTEYINANSTSEARLIMQERYRYDRIVIHSITEERHMAY